MGPELPAGGSCPILASEEVSERPDPDVNREVRCARRDVTRQMKDVRWAGVGGGGFQKEWESVLEETLVFLWDWNLKENRQEAGAKACAH